MVGIMTRRNMEEVLEVLSMDGTRLTRYAIGIDPGFVETGVVLRDADSGEVLAWKVFRQPPNGSTFERCRKLSDKIAGFIADLQIKFDMCYLHDDGILEIAMERPIYNNNPDSFEKQWRLFQTIAAELADFTWRPAIVLVEVPPATSKKLATGKGSATKTEIAEASPFARGKRAEHTWHTLGDAWAHSLATYGGCAECTRIKL